MKRDLNFHYLLAIRDEDLSEVSPFRAYSKEIVRIAPLLFRILKFPVHPIQFVMNREAVIQQRMMGSGGSILPLQVSAFSFVKPSAEVPLWCVVSTTETADFAAEWVRSAPLPVLHLCASKHSQATELSEVSDETFVDHTLRVLEPMSAGDHTLTRLCADLKKRRQPWPIIQLDAVARDHGVTRVNELLLENFNYRFSRIERLASMKEADYVDAIIKSADLVVQERYRVVMATSGWYLPVPVDLILATPSLLKARYSGLRGWINVGGQQFDRFRKALKAFVQQKSYMILAKESDLLTDGKLSAEYGALGELMHEEMGAFNAGCAIRAAHNFSPVLRLPPRVNHAQNDLRRLGDSIRSVRSTNIKANRLTKVLANTLSAAVPPAITDFVKLHGQHIKLIGDAPLEFFRFDGLPLSISRETSRIPATPGNLMLLNCLAGHRLFFPLSSFEEILVARSFADDDPIRDHFRKAIEVSQGEELWRTQLRHVDVSSPDELVAACNSFDGAVMVFDGHGSHKGDVGTLTIGNESVDIWTLRGKLRLPPIVILSACDTHPPDRSHASTANGLLNCGAVTVLSTMLPIDAASASVFLTRLIFRIERYLPIITKAKDSRSVTWAAVVWAVLRMMYATELIRSIDRERFAPLTNEQQRDLMSDVNLQIAIENPDWWTSFRAAVVLATGRTEEELDAFIDAYHQLPEAMKYVQLGNPEQLVILGQQTQELFEGAQV